MGGFQSINGFVSSGLPLGPATIDIGHFLFATMILGDIYFLIESFLTMSWNWLPLGLSLIATATSGFDAAMLARLSQLDGQSSPER